MARAEALWAETEATVPHLEMQVTWSGGIDSTGALVSLIRTAGGISSGGESGSNDIEADGKAGSRLERLVVVISDDSVAEYPLFFETVIKRLGLRVERGCDSTTARTKVGLHSAAEVPWSLTDVAIRYQGRRLTITGEHGDQTFGSDRCKTICAPGGDMQHFGSLSDPWQQVILPALKEQSLLCGTEEEWERWIAPQLAKSPFPIVSAFDLLWWLNFSCKYQNVALRALHFGGDVFPFSLKSSAGILGPIRHFYTDRQLECWSGSKRCHDTKFGDLSVWCTYKEPLKRFIRDYTGDNAYYETKEKVGSLTPIPDAAGANGVNSLYGVLRYSTVHTEVGDKASGWLGGAPGNSSGSVSLTPAGEHLALLRWGVQSLLPRKNADLFTQLVNPEFMPSAASISDDIAGFEPPGSVQVVDPWTTPPVTPPPFQLAPWFASEDERKHRTWNPVFETTLVGKCAALIPPDLVRGRTVLDLGACIGAMCHYALCAGASKATAVEVQEDFCHRAQKLMSRAHSQETSFEVVNCGVREFLAKCPPRSFDVVIAAGLLHCFTDPITVVRDMMRVARVAICLEVDHPDIVSSGSIFDGEVNGLRSPQIGSRNAGMSGNPALLQLAVQGLVNSSGGDSSETGTSFQGVSVVPSRAMLEKFLSLGNFEPERVYLKPHPTSGDVDKYTKCMGFVATPGRFFLRAVRRQRPEGSETGSADAEAEREEEQSGDGLQFLEESVTTGTGSKVAWKSKPNWWTTDQSRIIRPTSASPEEKAAHETSPAVAVGEQEEKAAEDDRVVGEVGGWNFDRAVAERFDEEADRHIPDYRRIIHMSVAAVLAGSESSSTGSGPDPSGADPQGAGHLRAIDIGCATGNTLEAFLRAGFSSSHISGVDCAEAMLAVARDKLPPDVVLHCSRRFPSEGPSPGAASFDGIVANWTLHFITDLAVRKQYIEDMARALRPGGVLVLTDKTNQDPFLRNLYHDWKRSRGVSEQEVQAKAKKIKGVLVTTSTSWYEETLAGAGFASVHLASAQFGFTTWIARK